VTYISSPGGVISGAGEVIRGILLDSASPDTTIASCVLFCLLSSPVAGLLAKTQLLANGFGIVLGVASYLGVLLCFRSLE
jgi:hypothetical protein